MKDNNKIADQLDDLISQLFKSCQTLKPIPSDYLFFKDELTPDACWIILIFFKTGELNKAIKNGACYRLHEYFWSNLSKIEGLNKVIFFEEGQVPEDTDELNIIFAKATEKLIAISDNTKRDNCSICNHNFNSHQLLGEVDKELGYPTKGWLICPEENCNCFRIWDHQIG